MCLIYKNSIIYLWWLKSKLKYEPSIFLILSDASASTLISSNAAEKLGDKYIFSYCSNKSKDWYNSPAGYKVILDS